jgi:hypothetical protein
LKCVCPATYPDTNNQFAYKNHRDDFLKGIRDRAETLWLDDYRVTWVGNTLFTFCVYREGQPGGYHTDPIARTCTSKFMTDQREFPLTEDGTPVECKHLLGLPALVKEEVYYWGGLRKTA